MRYSAHSENEVVLSRRQMLLGTVAAAALPMAFGRAWAEEHGQSEEFSFEWLTQRMRRAAGADYAAPEPISGPLAALDYDGYRKLRFRTESARWAGEDAPFELHAYPLGWLFDAPVALYEVAESRARRIGFGWDDFAYDDGTARDLAGEADFPGVAGFRLNAKLNDPARYDELVSFLGASYFRALGKDNVYGLSARGLAVNTALGGDEEFPRFTAFWLERPAPGSEHAVIYAALDSPSVTGAYRFVVTPGEVTQIEVNARLFFRRDIQQLGIAPLTSMFLFADNDPGAFDDYRNAVHDSDALVMESGGTSYIRPLTNPPSLGNAYLGASDPVSFGLVQRARGFEHYLDGGAHYERRPSLIVEPIGQWGPGAVRLIEIPSELEVHDNIVAFWVPEAPARAGEELEISYRLHWGTEPPGAKPAVAHVRRTLSGRGGVAGVEAQTGHKKFVIDFEGGRLPEFRDVDPAEPNSAARIDTRVSASGGQIAETVLSRIDGTDIWRLVIEVDAKPGQLVEMRADLVSGDEPLSEMWLYQWMSE